MFAKNPVLKALGILTSEDILELASFEEAIVSFKQVAGGEWLTEEVVPAHRVRKKMAEVLPFPKKETVSVAELPQLEIEGDEEILQISGLTTDFILGQRELSQKISAVTSTQKAFDEYVEQVKLLIVQSKEAGGKRRIRFVPTHGVLIDKKQS